MFDSALASDFMLSPAKIEVFVKPGEKIEKEIFITNRLGRSTDFIVEVEDFIGYDAWILSSGSYALKHIGLHPSKKITLYNGPIECKFQKFGIYKGSKKKNKQLF